MTEWDMNVPSLMVLSYLIGSFPTSYVLGRLYGVDLREEGSGNLGGSNAFRVLGPGAAALVLPLDVLKGFLPVWFFPRFDGSAADGFALAYGLCALIGHIWPAFTRFHGGKGVATGAGTLLALAPLAATVGILVWIGIVLITRIASVASLIAATLVPAVAYVAAAPQHTVLYATGLAAIVWWTHRENISRLIHRRERRLDLRTGTPEREDEIR